jgi:hypothetical protein
MIRRIVITSACVAVAALGPAALASAESLSRVYVGEGLITSLAADPYPPGTVVITHSDHSGSSSDDDGSFADEGGAEGASSGGVSESKSESRTNGHKNKNHR